MELNQRNDTRNYFVDGIDYSKPDVYLLNESGIGVAELAARTCYDSFENSENECIRDFDSETIGMMGGTNVDVINSIEDSALLSQLAWVHHHHSIIEHSSLSFLIKGTSRAVLQEHARHRLQNISVRSTRYTMSNVINAYVASKGDINFFITKFLTFDMLVTSNINYNMLEATMIFNKLKYQEEAIGTVNFRELSVSKSSLHYLNESCSEKMFELLENGKKKRNIGDAFKHIVNDNWKVDMVVTMNLRALKNYFDLRDSGAAYFQIKWLAEEMKKATPLKYLKLIDKKFKN